MEHSHEPPASLKKGLIPLFGDGNGMGNVAFWFHQRYFIAQTQTIATR
ncbi:MAG: hypothetical protein K0B01_05705 [Syntrophobacterales bacterium]|nr:hypothetical protein [Syntrophobacterales bacterium]